MCSEVNKMRFLVCLQFIMIFIISGCSINTRSSSNNTFYPTPTSRGELLVELNSDPEYPKPTMREICRLYGGLDESSLYKVNGSWMEIGYTRWSYACNGFKPDTQQQVVQSSTKIVGIDTAKTTCKELGFNVGTEKFGKCVLQLSK